MSTARFRPPPAAVRIAPLLPLLLLPVRAAAERKVPVPPPDLPAAVRQAIQDAVPNGRIVAIEQEVEGEDPGQYDVEVVAGGRTWEIELSPDGRLLERKAVADAPPPAPKAWSRPFAASSCTFATVGRNRFFVLVPGHQLVLESADEKVVITVLDETRQIGPVETRVVEEREEENGELKEISRNFFAICREHGDVFYFGEEVDDYEDGKVVAHGGAWQADQPDAEAGILMPGTPLLGARHYQEIAPNAMDRAEIVGDDVTLVTPAGIFEHCLFVEETSGLDPGERCYKTYAPGIGLVQDEDLLLTGCRTAPE